MDQKVFLNNIKEQVLKEDENASVILFRSSPRETRKFRCYIANVSITKKPF
jgi:hypothetical protein